MRVHFSAEEAGCAKILWNRMAKFKPPGFPISKQTDRHCYGKIVLIQKTRLRIYENRMEIV